MSKTLRALLARKAAVAADWRKLQDSAADRDFTAEEQAQADGYKASLEDINRRIEAEQALIAAEISPDAPVTRSPDVQVGEDRAALDPRRGFATFGEFARTVRAAATSPHAIDRRLTVQAAAPSTYSNELSGADGGFAVPPQFSTEIWNLSLGEGSLVPRTENTEVSGNSMVFPKDETTPWGGSGVQAYWRAEGPAATGSKLALGTNVLRLHEMIVLCPVTNELLDDAPALGSYLAPLAAERIMWKTNEAILFGTGAGQPKGAFDASNAAAITVAKETSQTAFTINQANLSKMVSRLKAGELMNAVWIGNPDILPALEAMTVGNYPIYLPSNNVAGPSYGMLKGRPLLMSEHAQGLGYLNDLMLVSLKGYRTITKRGGIESATSMHIYFDANAMAFRWIFRIDGQPILSAAIAAPSGKNSSSRSYYINLAARTS